MKKNLMKLWKPFSVSLGLCVALTFTACNGPATDTDNDLEAEGTEVVAEDNGLYDRERFSTEFTGTNYYEDWDMNDDNFLDENEFNEGYYGAWDANNDGMLEENEWNEGSQAFGVTGTTWADWDTDKNNRIDKNEFNTGTKNMNYYGTWDADRNSQLTEREFNDGLFGLWDDNKDGFVERDRYNTYSSRYFGD